MRRAEEILIRALMCGALALVGLGVGSVLWSVLSRGVPVLTWEMVSETPGSGFFIGGDGGFLNAIAGSVYIVVGSAVAGLAISLPIVFYLNVFLKQGSRLAYALRLGLDVLFGIPSIVYGAFAFSVMVALGIRASLLGGITVETLLIIPIMARSMDEVARTAPRDLLEAAYSLGATRLEAAKILARQTAPAIATATLLSVGRAMGDTAGVMFTAGFTDYVPESLTDKAATLPLAVFFQLSSPKADVQARAFAAAVVLTAIVLALSLTGRLAMRWFSKNKV